MNRLRLSFIACVLIGAAALAAQPQNKPEMKMQASAVPSTPEWQKLRSLVGSWEGVMEEGGTKTPATLDVRMTGDNSAIVHVMAPGTPQEMVTMIHPDGKRVLATHYCAAHNQPRMALVPAKAPNQVAFNFVDGTNIAPGDTHITGIVFTFTDADHHDETWSGTGGAAPAVFKFTRKK